MSKLDSFSKIFTLGHRTLKTLYDGPVEISEKVDGSQLGFGKIGGEVVARSKGKMLIMDACDNMFSQAITQIQRIADKIPDGCAFWGEYLSKPKHNLLAYSHVPHNNIMLFGMTRFDDPEWVYSYDELGYWAGMFQLDVARVLYEGEAVKPPELFLDQIHQLLLTESFLGGTKIEGIVIKNWAQSVLVGDQYIYPLCGKFVSEKFKEKMGQSKNQYSGKGRWEDYKDSFRTEARWLKAIQHLRDNGELLGEPKDIGPLLKEINRDISDECKEEIMAFLWKEFGKDLCRKATAGFAEWYKEYLLKNSFDTQ